MPNQGMHSGLYKRRLECVLFPTAIIVYYLLTYTHSNDMISESDLFHYCHSPLRALLLALFELLHIPGHAECPPFCSVVDIPRRTASLEIPILEWSDAKNSRPPQINLLTYAAGFRSHFGSG